MGPLKTATAPVTPAAGRIVRSMEELVGNTPLMEVRLPHLPDSVRLLAKLEMFDPLLNVKDRPALYMMRQAEASGALPARGGTVIECSSGSTGISLAALSARRGHRCIILMPDNATEERRQILREFGAEVVLVPHEDGLPAAGRRAEELQRNTPGPARPPGREPGDPPHYETTGPEIWEATGGQVDVLVCGVGTGGHAHRRGPLPQGTPGRARGGGRAGPCRGPQRRGAGAARHSRHRCRATSPRSWTWT